MNTEVKDLNDSLDYIRQIKLNDSMFAKKNEVDPPTLPSKKNPSTFFSLQTSEQRIKVAKLTVLALLLGWIAFANFTAEQQRFQTSPPHFSPPSESLALTLAPAQKKDPELKTPPQKAPEQNLVPPLASKLSSEKKEESLENTKKIELAEKQEKQEKKESLEREYRIVQGDTLYKIAKRQMGKGSLVDYLAEYNKIDDPSKIRVGQVLKIPALPQEE
jgi:LysM repeat protein